MTIALVEAVGDGSTSTRNSVGLTFGATPNDGELIVLCAHQDSNSGASTYTFPLGFTALTQTAQTQMAYKVASSESGAVYTVGSDVTEEFHVHGWRFSKDAGAAWAHLAGAGGSDAPVTEITTGDADGSSATGDFVSPASAYQQTGSGEWSGSNTFGGTATGGSDVEDGDQDPAGAVGGADIMSTAAHRIWTGAGTVNYTSKTGGGNDTMAARVELFEEQAGGGATEVPLAGAMPAASGVLAFQQSVFPTGNMPASSGVLALSAQIGLTGSMPAASGDLSTLYQIALTGDQPSASGALTAQSVVEVGLTGDMPNATGVLSQKYMIALNGTSPSASGVLQLAAQIALAGNMPAPAGALAILYMIALTGNMPNATGVLSISELTPFERITSVAARYAPIASGTARYAPISTVNARAD